MKGFFYEAWNARGEKMEGIRQARTEEELLGWMKENGLTAVAVEVIPETESASKAKIIKRRVCSADLAAFCWQLSSMLEGGVPITMAMNTIVEDVENPTLASVLADISVQLNRGETLFSCVERHSFVFNSLARAMILAGETGGTLVNTLSRLSEYYDSKDKIARKVKAAMSYPVFVVFFITLIVISIMTFIIPKFKIIFDQMGNELPAFTQTFLNGYDWIVANLLYLALGFVGIIAALVILYHTRKGHLFFSRMFLRLPIIGKLLTNAFLANFCRTFSTLLQSGVPVLEAFEILTSMSANDVMKKAVQDARMNIMKGTSISLGMSLTGFFPRVAVKMTQVGEEGGSMAEVLDKISEYYLRKMESLIATLTGLLEPILIITIGAIVAFVIIALYLPIFSMAK